jgi:hypothetical protein
MPQPTTKIIIKKNKNVELEELAAAKVEIGKLQAEIMHLTYEISKLKEEYKNRKK